MSLTTTEEIEDYCENLASPQTEHAHQKAFFAWLNIEAHYKRHPMATVAFAIPNGGKRDAITASRLKAEGVKPGVADICYPVPHSPYHSLWIEMKKPTKGKVAPHQDNWAITMRVCGHAVVTCYGWKAARQAFLNYTNSVSLEEEYKP